MSDSFLRYVPVDPRFQPEPAAADHAKALLASYLPEAQAVVAEFSDQVQFVDPGENWSGVFCPHCNADAEPWWSDAVSRAYEDRFRSLDITMPCCGVVVSLNDLRYVWPVAFGRFVLEAMNPNVKGLSAPQMSALAQVVGCPLREIAAHV